MIKNEIHLGKNLAFFEEKKTEGTLVNLDGEYYYKISNSDEIRPFFMSLVSDSNHWMFISSNGGLTAGRKDSDHALFPYYTDDKISESSEITGSKTILQVYKNNKTTLWEPFSIRNQGLYKIERNLYKNNFGNKLIFEEINLDLEITFRYQWNTSDRFGFVKNSSLINNGEGKVEIGVLDGLQNLLPAGLSSDFQNIRSNLVDAYKRNELVTDVGVGIYALSAIIVDKAEPSESLKSSIVWSTGFNDPTYLLSSLQLDEFRRGRKVYQESDVKAEKGAYFICDDVNIKSGETKEWMIIANVNQSLKSINEISEFIRHEKNPTALIQKDIEKGTEELIKITAAADGIQLTRDKLGNTRHFANTLFNIMRGGIFDKNYQIEKLDFIQYIEKANRIVFDELNPTLESLPEMFPLRFLKDLASQSEDVNFKRLSFEYMPLRFSRRHGDPSRPWNKFSINTTNEIDGSKILDYEGNWRDIFQNWEALACSYPEFIESMIHKFLNATTFDGYNPYRVTKDGFDWEVIEPNDPWSYIGYWGDHQIVYLLKFLEFIEDHYPKKLANYFNQEIFVYANVPYRIKSYSDILSNPKDTIDFNTELDHSIEENKKKLGADGALLTDKDSTIHQVNLIEKLLATVLAKLSNFIPEAGIWLNTQRPEWNDANNALVGNGVSVVTLCYLKRFLNFFEKSLGEIPNDQVEVSEELVLFFSNIASAFYDYEFILSGKVSDEDRKKILDKVGNAGSIFRTTIYENRFSGYKSIITKSELEAFLKVSNKYLEHTIRANKRQDDLYHAYNLMTVNNNSEISISYLSEMLEGQVAVLTSGLLDSSESLKLLDALKSSSLFRADQYSYLLYPNKTLDNFKVKNTIPKGSVEKSELFLQLLKDNNSQVIEKDVLGKFHFNSSFNNSNSLIKALSELPKKKYNLLIEKDQEFLLEIFEELFDHKSFTGRSGTFFGYEGLGSIYWHMVSKLLLAVQENCLKAIENKENDQLIGNLLDHYYEINEGIGVHKSPELYGAFPTDPYSHTPATKGAQQPGMTGQVKEDILSRFGELGVSVKNGCLNFNPSLLRREEFLEKPGIFEYFNTEGESKKIDLQEGCLCFTYCQIPIVYKLSEKNGMDVFYSSGNKTGLLDSKLSKEISKQVFERLGVIEKVEVLININKKPIE